MVPLLLAILVVTSVLGCSPATVEDDASFDVVIYVIDACRADRIGAYGYQRPTTPAIDALADDPDAVVFDRFYVAGNWTKPATASLFTGRWVHQHGVTNRHSELAEGLYKSEVLGEEFVTLAESFRDAGYATLGLVTSHHLGPTYGFDQGFSTYFDPENLKVGDVGRNKKLIDLVWSLDSAYFAYVHQNACHYPFQQRDRDPEFMVEFGFDYDEASRAESVDFTTSAIRDAIVDGQVQLTPEDARFLSLIYDAKLRKVDREVVAPIIEGLRRAGRWDRTLFILTADHGEELYEHGGYAHGFAMWEEVIRVPLIVKFPKGMRPPGLSKRVDTLTSNVDLYPSLLAMLGHSIPEDLVGRSILDLPKDRFIFSQGLTHRPTWGATDWAVILDQDQEKLIVERSGRRLLFDLEEDPGEKHDLGASQPERVEMLVALGEAAGAGSRTAETPEVETELSPEVIETLRSLGYLD